MKYTSIEISPLDLYLDTKNPRFIVKPNATQADTIEYLLKYEEIVELSKAINKNEGLLIGERIIVCKENDRYVVLEGNRRTCSCKLLLDTDLIPEPFKDKFVKVSKGTRANIEKIQVDVAPTRLDAQLALASKHIDGIKKWSTLSKIKFYAGSYEEGKDVEFISQVTGTKIGKIKDGIKNYNLLSYALNLKNALGLKYYDLIDIQKALLDPFFRIFTTKSEKYNIYTRELLKLSFDEQNFKLKTQLSVELFDECIGIIVEKTLIEKTINTRNKIDDIEEIIRILEPSLANGNSESSENNEVIQQTVLDKTLTLEDNRINKNTFSNENISSNTSIIPEVSYVDGNNISEMVNSNTKNNNYLTVNSRIYIIPNYFSCKTKSTKINQMLYELSNLDAKKFTISACILLRCFIEQISKCYADICGLNYDHNTSLQQLISACINDMIKKGLISKEMHSSINSVIKNPDTSYVTFLNGIVHQQESYPGREILVDVFNVFEEYIKQILNKI